MFKFFTLLFVFASYLAASVGQIAAFSGEVTIHRDDDKITATRGFDIKQQDMVYTKANSRAQVVFSDDTVITIGQNAVLDIAEFVYDMQNPQNSKADIGFMEGTFRAVTGSVGNVAPDRFNLKTKSASIGIRGTVILGDQSTIAVAEGEIAVTAQGVTQIVGAGMMTRTPEGQPPTAPEPIDEEVVREIEQDTTIEDTTLDVPDITDDTQQEEQEDAQQEQDTQEPQTTIDTEEIQTITSEDRTQESIDEALETPADFSFYGFGWIVEDGAADELFEIDYIGTDDYPIEIVNIQSDPDSDGYIAKAKVYDTSTSEWGSYDTYAFELDDDLYWGYWRNEQDYPDLELPWIAGIPYEMPSGEVSFTGNVRGVVESSDETEYGQILMNENNLFAINIDFGGDTDSIIGTLNFDDSLDNEWRTVLSGNHLGEGGVFNGDIEHQVGTTPKPGSFSGQAFGDGELKAVGGKFTINSEEGNSATGVFKATKD